MTSLEGMSKNIHEITVRKGFWEGLDEKDPFPFLAYKLAMIHSEVTETLEAVRKDKGDEEIVLEIADIIIRVLDFYEGLRANGEIVAQTDLDTVIADKIVINQGRGYRHGVRG